MTDAPESGPRARVMIVMEDGGVFLAITRPGESIVRVPLTNRDVLRLVGEGARVATSARKDGT